MDEETLKHLQNVELEIMEYVHRVCVNNNIRYFMVGGTLLGAVRHHGFIPWDDDCDIAMPRADFNRFIDICQKGALGKDFILQYIITDDNYLFPYAKVRKNNTYFDEEKLKGIDCHKGIFIDIFPLDFCKRNYGFFYHTRARLIKFLAKLIIIRVLRIKAKNILMKIIRGITNFLTIQQMSVIRDKIASSCQKGDYYINYGSFYDYTKQTMKVELYEPAQLIEFQSKKFYAPRDSIGFLENLYGDWQKLPSEEKRRNHNASKIIFDTRREI